MLEHSLRPSTLKAYDGILTRFRRFCEQQGYSYFPTTTTAVAHFLRDISSTVERPGSTLITASAAIAAMYRGSEHCDPTKSQLLTMLKQAITNTGTKRPRVSTPVFPIDRLTAYLITLGENNIMSVDKLRSKTISLLALVGLYRPADLALLQLQHLEFTHSGVNISNFGGKTDKNRDGIPTMITRASDPHLCPVTALECYISRTAARRATLPDSPVFIYLEGNTANKLSDQRVATVLKNTLRAAGIDEATARSFRKTGASSAINKGVDPDLVMKLGRWRSVDVFYRHYVDWEQAGLTDTILAEN
jgi:integrase